MNTLRDRFHDYYEWHRSVRITEAASAVAFWIVLAFGPAGLVAINVLGLVFDQQVIASHLVVLANAAPGSFGDLLVNQLLVVAAPSPGSWWMDVLLVLAGLWTVSTAVAMLLRGLRRGFGQPIASFAIVRILGGTLGLTAIIVIGTVAFVIDANSTTQRIIGIALGAATAFALVLGLYWLAAGASAGLRRLWPGALVAAVGLVAIQFLWENLTQASPSLLMTYGSLAGLITSLLSVWLAAFVVLLGPYVNRTLTPRLSPAVDDHAGTERWETR